MTPGDGVHGRRICIVGDALVVGVGDPKGLGWVGRVAARTPREVPAAGIFPLGVQGESTHLLVGRWREETSRRFAEGADNRLVVGLGHADLGSAISLARSRLNLANVLDDARSRGVPAFVVGPPPSLDTGLNPRIGELADAFADVCQRRDVPYVDTYAPLATHEQWFADLSAGDGVHPGQSGYGLLAWLVLHGGWHDWLGVQPDA